MLVFRAYLYIFGLLPCSEQHMLVLFEHGKSPKIYKYTLKTASALALKMGSIPETLPPTAIKGGALAWCCFEHGKSPKIYKYSLKTGWFRRRRRKVQKNHDFRDLKKFRTFSPKTGEFSTYSSAPNSHSCTHTRPSQVPNSPRRKIPATLAWTPKKSAKNQQFTWPYHPSGPADAVSRTLLEMAAPPTPTIYKCFVERTKIGKSPNS